MARRAVDPSRTTFVSAVMSTYAAAQPGGGDHRLGAEGWVELLETVGSQRGLLLPREQLLQMFEAARGRPPS